jgi:hypothetical protein
MRLALRERWQTDGNLRNVFLSGQQHSVLVTNT